MADEELEPLVQGRFTWTFNDGTVYSDAIVLPKSQYEALTNAEIREMRRERARAWKQQLDATRSYRPTEAELRAERRERRQRLRAQRDALLGEIATLDAEIAAEV